MKYHAALSVDAGLNTLPYNACQLLDFGLLRLADGETYRGVADGRERLAVLLGGKANFTIGDKRFDKVGGRPNVFAGKPHSVYIPAGVEFSIEAIGAVEIALPSAPSDLEVEPYVIAPAQTGNHYARRFTHGHACIVDPWGTILADAGEQPGMAIAEINPTRLKQVRQQMPSLQHRIFV